ncbi:MAG: class I SAM-dependent methyltransferase [Fimbriimonas sp.]
MSALPPHVQANREAWTKMSVGFQEPGRRSWSTPEITWGIWSVPEAEIEALGDLTKLGGKDVVELGCGTAYFSAWLARRGARPVGIDITPAQLANARAFQLEFGIEFPLLETV